MQNIEQRVEVETVQPLPPPAPPSSFAPGRYGVSPLIAAASGREQPGGASMQTHSAEEGQYNRRTKGRGCGDRRCRNLMDNAGGSNYGLCTKGLTDGDDGKEHTYNIYWTIALIALLHRDNRTSDHIQLNSKSIYEKNTKNTVSKLLSLLCICLSCLNAERNDQPVDCTVQRLVTASSSRFVRL